MSKVFVLDAEKRPLSPCTPARARLLLKQQKAAVLRHFPFSLILKEAKPDAVALPLRLKIDPGSQTTGIAVVNDVSGEVVWAAEIKHRGDQVRKALTIRRGVRHSRRLRHTRYREPRYRNRRRPKGWLPPRCSRAWTMSRPGWHDSRAGVPLEPSPSSWCASIRTCCSTPILKDSCINEARYSEQNSATICWPNGNIAARTARPEGFHRR